MVQISIHNHRFRDEGKKRSSSRNLRLRYGVHPCFCPRAKVYLRLEGNKQYFRGGTKPEKPLVAPG